MNIKLIAFDLDGTTFNSQTVISDGNAAALRKAYKAGIKLIPCTGRPMYEIPPKELSGLIDEFGLSVFPWFITDNGAQVYDLSRKELLYSNGIQKETALKVLAKGRSHFAITYGSFGIQSASDNRGLIWETAEMRTYIDRYSEIWKTPFANLEELIEWNNGVVKMSMNFVNHDDYVKCLKEFSLLTELDFSSAALDNIEFMRAGTNKGEALEFVAKHSGVPMNNIMTIGDNRNDMEMIQKAGFGVAMGNAIPELKEKADWVTATNDDDGLALAIEKILSE
jgi:Cof subfamily protein (haloacid dehalogenase superfamily)